jgi:hypothetical protein
LPNGVEGDRFNAERPQLLSTERFSANAPISAFGPGFDLHPDGERFAVAAAIRPADSSTQSRLVFVFNAFDEARRLGGALTCAISESSLVERTDLQVA